MTSTVSAGNPGTSSGPTAMNLSPMSRRMRDISSRPRLADFVKTNARLRLRPHPNSSHLQPCWMHHWWKDGMVNEWKPSQNPRALSFSGESATVAERASRRADGYAFSCATARVVADFSPLAPLWISSKTTRQSLGIRHSPSRV